MKIINASYIIEMPEPPIEMLKRIERAARVCYKSEDKITDTSYVQMIKMLIKSNHLSVLEHGIVSVKFITDRGVLAELTRHRIGASYSVESTRYCSYNKGKFGKEITYIHPDFELNQDDVRLLSLIEEHYMKRLEDGLSPQQARYFLPQGLKTEIVATYNLREWRHVMCLRTSPKAHPQMRELMIPLLLDFKDLIPIVFEDIEVK